MSGIRGGGCRKRGGGGGVIDQVILLYLTPDAAAIIRWREVDVEICKRAWNHTLREAMLAHQRFVFCGRYPRGLLHLLTDCNKNGNNPN